MGKWAKKMYWEELPKRVSGTYKGSVDWDACIGMRVKYKNYDVFKINNSHFKECKIGKLLRKVTSEFKLNIGDVINNKNSKIIITERKVINGLKKYKFKCSCGFECGKHYKRDELIEEYWLLESSILSGKGCSCCSIPSKILVPGINDMFTTAHFMINLGVDEQTAKVNTKCSTNKISIKCPHCNIISNKQISGIYSRKSIGCTCGDGFSFGHKYVFNILTQLRLDFEDNKTLEWCKYPDYKNKNKIVTGEYDFIIESDKLIIEVDGDFHREDNRLSGQTKEHSKYLDDMKDLRALDNGYKIIRISDKGDIKDNILNSKLIDMFELKYINWENVLEYSMSNLAKISCEIFNRNPNISPRLIGKTLGVTSATIICWLKKWSKLGLCNYNQSISQRQLVSKSVEVFKDNINLGTFESTMDVERRSLGLFGVKLGNSQISAVARGVQKNPYKGFTFKYVDKEVGDTIG